MRKSNDSIPPYKIIAKQVSLPIPVEKIQKESKPSPIPEFTREQYDGLLRLAHQIGFF